MCIQRKKQKYTFHSVTEKKRFLFVVVLLQNKSSATCQENYANYIAIISPFVSTLLRPLSLTKSIIFYTRIMLQKMQKQNVKKQVFFIEKKFNLLESLSVKSFHHSFCPRNYWHSVCSLHFHFFIKIFPVIIDDGI